MQKVVRLAQLLELKYGLQSKAANISEDRIIAEVKRDVLDAFRNYFSRSARDSMFQYAADLGEDQCSELVYKMDKLVKDLDKMIPQKLMESLNDVIGLMYRMKKDPTRAVRNVIHDSVPGGTEAQRNTRQRLLTKYERSMSMAFPALQKAAIKLQVVVPDVAVHGGEVSRERSELSKQQLIDFIIATPAFKTYGIDSFDVMEEFLSDPDMRQRLITLINAVKRGHVPLDGPQVQEFARQVKQLHDQRKQTNLPQLEEPEPQSQPEGEE